MTVRALMAWLGTIAAVLGLLAGGVPTPQSATLDISNVAAVKTASSAEPMATNLPDDIVVRSIGCTSVRRCREVHGGAYMATTREACTMGLPVFDRRTHRAMIVTAGHCVIPNRGLMWRHNGRSLGTSTGQAAMDHRGDFGYVQILAGRGWAPRSRVLYKGQSWAITGVRNARLNERVCTTGALSRTTRCGTVVNVSTSASYAAPHLPARRVGHLILVKDICSRPGDSGSPLFRGHEWVGLVVAKANVTNGPCYTLASRGDTAAQVLGFRLM